MHIDTFAGAHIERGEGAQLLAQQMHMHGAGRQNHRNGSAIAADPFVGQNDMGGATTHRILDLTANHLQGIAQRIITARGIEGAIDLGGAFAHIGTHGFDKTP